jgi:hypothetical protein
MKRVQEQKWKDASFFQNEDEGTDQLAAQFIVRTARSCGRLSLIICFQSEDNHPLPQVVPTWLSQSLYQPQHGCCSGELKNVGR